MRQSCVAKCRDEWKHGEIRSLLPLPRRVLSLQNLGLAENPFSFRPANYGMGFGWESRHLVFHIRYYPSGGPYFGSLRPLAWLSGFQSPLSPTHLDPGRNNPRDTS